MASRVQGLRASVRGERTDRKKSGWKGGYRDRLDIPKGEATPVLFTKGEYLDERPKEIKDNGGAPPTKHYHVHKSHGFKLSQNDYRSARCVAGYVAEHDATDTCMACRRKAEGDNRVGTRDVYSLNCVQLALHQKVELRDRDGKIIRFDEDGKNHKRGDTIMTWEEITAARDLRDAKQELEERLEAGVLSLYRKKFVQVGLGHLDNIMAIDEIAARKCKCGGKLEPISFNCAKCGELLVDVVDANLDKKEVDRFDAERQRCKKCDSFAFAERVMQCNECDNPSPLSIFDVVAFLRKSGEGTSSTIVCEQVVPLTEFTLANGAYLLKIDDRDNSFATDDDGAFVLDEDFAKVTTQFDFDTVHRVSDNDYICQVLRVENEMGSRGGTGGGSRRYGSREETREPEDGQETRKPAPGIKRPAPGLSRGPSNLR